MLRGYHSPWYRSEMALTRKQWSLIGFGALILGGYWYFHKRKYGSLGRARFVNQRYAEAPEVGGYSDGDMKTTLRASNDMPIEERVASIQALIHKSVQDPQMRKLALAITKNCPERDGTCEAEAVYQYVKKHVRYTGDIAPIKFPNGEVEGIDLYQSARRTLEMKGGDCLPLSTLVLRDDYELVTLAELEAGDRIMSENSWTVVQDRWLTGEKELLAFQLSNGCVLRCTADHKIFRNVEGKIEEIRAGEARVGDDLVTPQSLPIAEVSSNEWPASVAGIGAADLAWLLGIFVADGWADGKRTKDGWHPYRVGISGLDGKPKEAQKRRVQALMAQAGINTRWHEKYIAINDSALARFFANFGHTAINKNISLSYATKAEVHALIEGLSADADVRNGVHSTISPKLALQLRVLYRMVGQSTHIKRVDEHGGLGDNAIYRITPRAIDSYRRDLKFARIRGITDGGSEMCMDLTTDQGKFWLPESDVVVHNCDDQSIVVATLLALNGITPRLRVMKERKSDDWSHIFPLGGLPKTAPTDWVALDTTLPGNRSFGEQIPFADALDFPA
jgi:hypothetical protein